MAQEYDGVTIYEVYKFDTSETCSRCGTWNEKPGLFKFFADHGCRVVASMEHVKSWLSMFQKKKRWSGLCQSLGLLVNATHRQEQSA